MERAADYDEQSEVLFLFSEDADETQSQTDNPPHPTPPQPAPCPTTSEPTQPATTNLLADQSFWAEVYTLQPPHALMGVLTDLHVHRFVLHQHLDSPNALTETPIGHQPLTDTLPPPVQRLIAIYHNNVQRAQNHTRLALNAIDTLARFPPAAYFTDPNLGTQASPHPHTQADPLPSSIPPLRFYPIPTAAARHTTVQDAATQTFPPSVSIMANPLQPLLLHESQQTTPRPHTHTTATFRRASMPLSSFLLLPASCQHRKPTNRTPPFPPPAWLLPHHPTPHQPLTSNLTIDGNTSTSFPLPQLPCRNNHTHHRNFLPPSGAPPHATTPTRTRQPDPRTGSPTPHRTAPTTTSQQYHATVRPLPKRPPPSLYQAQQLAAATEPLQPVPPATGWPCFQGGSYTPTPSEAPPQTSAPPTHPWPAHYQVPTQQQPPLIPIQVGSSALAPPSPVVMLHPPTTGVDQQGPCLSPTKITILARIRGTRTTTEHAAADSALPTVLYPLMIYTPTTFFHIECSSCFWFQPDDPRRPSSSEARFS